MTLRGCYARSGGTMIMLCAIWLAVAGPPYGLESAEPVGPYLNGVFPAAAPPAVSTPRAWKGVDAFPNLTFSDVLVITPVPNSTLLCAADRQGRIHVFDDDPGAQTTRLIADLSDRVALPRDGGFLGLAFHPEFGDAASPNGRYVYASYNAAGNTMRLSRFSAGADGLTLDPASELVMIEQSHGEGKTHFGGSLAFGPDGMLYVPFGDAELRTADAQSIDDNLIGGILRIDVDMNPARSHPPRRRLPKTDPDEVSGRGYWIPNDNPFLDPDGAIFEEYFTLGHRNPWKVTADPETGRIWTSEVGHLLRDEFNVLVAGGNYGWYMREGSVAAVLPEPFPPPDPVVGALQEPVFDDRYGVVSGGVVYRGARYPSLQGAFIGYAGGIVALRLDAAGKQAAPTILVAANAVGFVWAFGTNQAGEVLFIEGGSNKTIKTLAPIYDPAEAAPALLSETGAFVDLASLTPAPGLIPYTPNAPAWADGARVSRWIAIPNDGVPDSPAEQIVFQENAPWQFPAGAVAVQHIELPVNDTDPSVRRRLETRFLIQGEDGTPYGLTYRWRADGTDAELLDDPLIEPIPVATPAGVRQQTWLYHGRDQCLACHTPGAGGFLGINTRQLNGPAYYPETGKTANQLATWNHIGLFSDRLDEEALPGYTSAAGPHDASASLEHRARSYLDVNCSHCHRPGGLTGPMFDARLTRPLEEAGLLDGAAIGEPGAVIVAPGDTSQSLLLQRMRERDTPAAMPPLATARVDTAGVRLVGEWIRSLGVHLTAFSPGRGLPGTRVELTGARLDATFAVTFNGAPAVFVVDGSDRLTAVVPDTATTGPIAVHTPHGTVQSAGVFEVLDAAQTGIDTPKGIGTQPTLLGVAPSPFNGRATVTYALAAPEHVRIRLYDARGRLVSVLVDSHRPAGRWQATIDGSTLASGVYLLRFEAGGRVETRTVTHIK